MVTDRDSKVISFIDEFKIATTDTIAELYYPSLTIAQRRLKQLVNHKVVKRDRHHQNMQYYYYINKPKQIRHSLLLTDFYREMNKYTNIELFKREYICENLRADGLIVYEDMNNYYIAFIEVHISNNPFNMNKYEKLYNSKAYEDYFNGVFPYIIAITNRTIPSTNLKVIKIKEDFSNLKEALYENR